MIQAILLTLVLGAGQVQLDGSSGNLLFETGGEQIQTGYSYKGLVLDLPLTSSALQSSTLASDKTPYSQHATITGGPTVASTGTTFDAASQYEKYASPFRTSDTSGSVCFWFNTNDAASGANYAFSASDELTTTNFITFGPMVSRFLVFERSTAGGINIVRGNTVIQNGTWYHGCVTSSGTTWKVYLNGSEDTPYNVSNGSNNGKWFADVSGADHYTVAVLERTTLSGYYNGSLFGVKVWDRVLSATEIGYLYTYGRRP